MSDTVLTKKKHRNLKPFVKGDPRINRNGRPRGSTDKTKILVKNGVENLVADALANLSLAIKAGDTKMTQWLLEQYRPDKLMQLTVLDIPKINTVDDLLEANTIVNEAMFNGEIAPVDANEVGKRLEDSRKLFQTIELQKILEKVECRIGSKA